MAHTAIIAGLGPGFCERLAWKLTDEGYAVGMFARSEGYLDSVESDLREAGRDALAVPTDLTDPDSISDGIGRVREAFGSVDGLAHTASVATSAEDPLDPDRFESMWRLYTHGALHCLREVLPDMRDSGGTILFFGADPEMGDVAYASAKDGARGLARTVANEYGPEGVHVAHVVIAGPILNPDVYERRDGDEVDEARYMDPDAVADVCLDLIGQERGAWTFELDLRPHAVANVR